MATALASASATSSSEATTISIAEVRSGDCGEETRVTVNKIDRDASVGFSAVLKYDNVRTTLLTVAASTPEVAMEADACKRTTPAATS